MIVEGLLEDAGLIWSVFYLDDGVLVGAADKVIAAFARLIEQARAVGLDVNLPKCEAWGPAADIFAQAFPTVAVVPWQMGSGITVLGAAIDFPQSCAHAKRLWQDATSKLGYAVQTVTSLPDLQLAHHLLRSCLDGCRVNHLLRTSDPYACDDEVRDADAAILAGFEDIVGGCLAPAQRTQAALPIRVGGCGLRSPALTRPAARISALASFYAGGASLLGLPDMARQVHARWLAPVVEDLGRQLGPNFDPVVTWSGLLNAVTFAEPAHCQQRWWAEALGRASMTRLLDVVPPRDQARLLEQSNGVGGCFMAITPSQALRTIIPSSRYRLGLRWWLGVPVVLSEASCPGCTAKVDAFGDHLLCCARINFQARHAAMQEGLANLLAEAGQGVAREVPLPVPADSPHARLRPADLLLRAWSNGVDTAVDLTISHGWQATESSGPVSRERWRSFLTRKEREKHAKYDGACESVGWRFLAMALGTWGGVGPEGVKILHRALKRSAGWLEGEPRAARQEELRLNFGYVLMSQIWDMLEAKNEVL